VEEFDWLSFMAAYKYDGYRDFCAGARFIESLATWLQQFQEKDRAEAYRFIKAKLIYFSPMEIERLVEKLVPELVQRQIVRRVADELGIRPYEVWSSQANEFAYSIELRKTLFMGLSDGARIDILRRMNAGIISNEQVVVATQIDIDKWRSLVLDLRKDLVKRGSEEDAGSHFNSVYLIDDFTASGTSLLPDPDLVGKLKGKLVKFLRSAKAAENELRSEKPFSDSLEIFVHHYIGTEEAERRINRVYKKVREQLEQEFGVSDVHFSYGLKLPDAITLTEKSSDPFVRICQSYYDPAIEGAGEHGAQSGHTDRMFGYGGCGLPVVLEHNTPNNSLSILHSRTNGDDGKHKMRPLFYRRERHSDLVVQAEHQSEVVVGDG
jgi:hypothetical protein